MPFFAFCHVCGAKVNRFVSTQKQEKHPLDRNVNKNSQNLRTVLPIFADSDWVFIGFSMLFNVLFACLLRRFFDVVKRLGVCFLRGAYKWLF